MDDATIHKRYGEATSGAAAAGLSTASSIGLALGVTALIFVGMVGATVWISRIRKRARRERVEIEDGLLARAPGLVDQQQMTRAPVARTNGWGGSRRGRLAVPLPQTQAGWDALGSSESVDGPVTVIVAPPPPPLLPSLPPSLLLLPPAKRRSSSSRRIRNSIRLTRFNRKHLSVIAEVGSPSRNESGGMTAQTQGRAAMELPTAGRTAMDGVDDAESDNVLARPDSSSHMHEILPCFAISSPSPYGVEMAGDDSSNNLQDGKRSVSTGVLDTDVAVFWHTSEKDRRLRPMMHVRSVSLGAPLTSPPSGPVPPLPFILPHRPDDTARQGMCVSRVSSASSINSMGSLVPIANPHLSAHEAPLPSPTPEEIVEKDRAELRSVVNRHWQNARNTSRTRIEKTRAPARGNMRYGGDNSLRGKRLSSSGSITSNDSTVQRRPSVPERTTVNKPSSMHSMKEVTVPQCSSKSQRRRSNVSVLGSPTERKRKSGVLRDISGNAGRPSRGRQDSLSTQGSERSSNGNLFHLDCDSAALSKPSALKGSPKARKGHRRKNCVRISALTPQVIGPASRSSSASPAGMMGEITEERENDELRRQNGDRIPSRGASAIPKTQKRQLSASSGELGLRVQTLRASLTSSSPTLSEWIAHHGGRAVSPPRHSNRSSCSSAIADFLIPNKELASGVVSQPTPLPEFRFHMESPTLGYEGEKKHNSNLFGPELSSDGARSSPPMMDLELPSSPPLPTSKTKEYDQAWFAQTLAASKEEYDPASPPAWQEPEMSSVLWRPFTFVCLQENTVVSRQTSHDTAEEPPCSPKSMPEGLSAHVGEAQEKLTSTNPSSIVALIPKSRPNAAASKFLGGMSVPMLPPPDMDGDDDDVDLLHWHPLHEVQSEPLPVRNRAVSISTTVGRYPSHPDPPAPTLPTIPQSDDSSPPPVPISTPLEVSAKTASRRQTPFFAPPQGRCSAPAGSVLKNAMALRRMNSQVRNQRNRESRNYIRLGSEANPFLPWSPEHKNAENESCDNVFDFDFRAVLYSDSDNGGTVGGSAMDDIDSTAPDNTAEGAPVGFEVSSSPQSPSTAAAGNDNKCSPSVWDDGEKFWAQEKTPCSRKNDSSRLAARLFERSS